MKNYIDSSSAGQRGRSGSSSSSSLVTWDGLFNGVVDYVIRECEAVLKLDREKPAASAGVQTSRKKMKQVRGDEDYCLGWFVLNNYLLNAIVLCRQ